MNSTITSNPLNKIIGLSVILSMGFLLVILAGIYGNWFPIIIGLVFAAAHLPQAITKAVSNSSDYDFNFDPSNPAATGVVQEIGLFVSAFLLFSGFALSLLLHHSHILTKTATILTIVGGTLIYGTVFTFSSFFDDQEEDDVPDLGGGVI